MQIGRGLRRIAYVFIAALWGLCLSYDQSLPVIIWLTEFTVGSLALVAIATWVARGFRGSPSVPHQR